MKHTVMIERTETYCTTIKVEAASADVARTVTQAALEADGYDDVCDGEDGDLEECVSTVVAVNAVDVSARRPLSRTTILQGAPPKGMLEYEWVCERNDATDTRDDETGLIGPNHIFRDIVTLRNWIDGTTTEPEEYVK